MPDERQIWHDGPQRGTRVVGRYTMRTRTSLTLWIWTVLCGVTAALGQDLYDESAAPVMTKPK